MPDLTPRSLNKGRRGDTATRADCDGSHRSLASNVRRVTADATPSDVQTGIDIISITKRFGAVTAVRDVSLHVARGEFVTLLGPSGSGKSTTLMMVAGHESPDNGAITINGRNVTYTPAHLRDIGMVFQHYALFPHLTVEQNV